MQVLGQRLLILEPQYRERVWGGQRLRQSNPPTGEAWIAFGPSVVRNGRLSGHTIDVLIARDARSLLGTNVARRYPKRFPILLKLLDCADWLSVQVHPNDEQARRLVGPGEFGKTEAWYFLDADANGRILAGVKPGIDHAALAEAIRNGQIVDVLATVDPKAGDALLIPAGTMHALGPGLLIYEIQQASDTTYRAYDWGRPQSPGRHLHIEESVAVARPIGPADMVHPEVLSDTGSARAIDCSLFTVDLVRVSDSLPWSSDTGGLAFQVITAIGGSAEISCGGECVELGKFETALIAGAAGAFQVRAVAGEAFLLRSTVPD